MVEFDGVLRGGDVIDGTGRPARRVDIGLRDGHIEALGDLSHAAAAEQLDVTGRCIAPGFIDVHAHTDLTALLQDDHLDVKSAGVRQGVTTEICGNCGYSPFPARSERVDTADPYLGLLPEGARRYYRSLAAYREAMRELPLISNLAPLVGHGRLRAVVMGYEDRQPEGDELDEMRRLAAEAMDDGAFGVSTGLMYAPGVFSDTRELVALAQVAGGYERPYTTHMRDEADRVENSLEEALRVGREATAPVEISHHKIAGARNWGRSQVTLAMIERARKSGLDVALDAYPYTAGSTFLAALLPPWVLEGGPDATLERLRDGRVRERIKRDYETGLPGWQNLVEMAGWANVIVAGEPPRAGRSIAELADGAGRTAPDYVAELLLDDPKTIVIIHLMDKYEVRTIADQPFAIVGSDGVPVPGQQHPRLAGTFARTLRRHAATPDRLTDAIRRMTGLPADRFGVPDRGTVEAGKVADLVVFDAATVTDNADYEGPLSPPTGVDHVMVAGRFVIRDGHLTDERPGRVLEPK